jgi:CheY-like chemotaxis protein
MLVEDKEILRCMGKSLLEETGFAILTALCGLEALTGMMKGEGLP